MPFDDDFETAAFFINANNIEAETTAIGTKRLFDIFESRLDNAMHATVKFGLTIQV